MASWAEAEKEKDRKDRKRRMMQAGEAVAWQSCIGGFFKDNKTIGNKQIAAALGFSPVRTLRDKEGPAAPAEENPTAGEFRQLSQRPRRIPPRWRKTTCLLAPSGSGRFAAAPDYGPRRKAIGPTMHVRPIILRLFGGKTTGNDAITRTGRFRARGSRGGRRRCPCASCRRAGC